MFVITKPMSIPFIQGPVAARLYFINALQ